MGNKVNKEIENQSRGISKNAKNESFLNKINPFIKHKKAKSRNKELLYAEDKLFENYESKIPNF